MMKKLFFLIIFPFCAMVTVYSQKVPDITGSKVTKAEAQEALDFHNKVRADVKVKPLEWSAELSKYAQEWADHLAAEGCNMQHRPYDGKWAQKYGENIFWGMGAAYSAIDASKSWYDEIKVYVHEVLNDSNWYKAGHYTQMVWYNTTHVGIGMAKCDDGGIIIVANYNPPGNYMGEKAY
ncbi:MAG: CAP family protein [Bacteroidales bacterium]